MERPVGSGRWELGALERGLGGAWGFGDRGHIGGSWVEGVDEMTQGAHSSRKREQDRSALENSSSLGVGRTVKISVQGTQRSNERRD